MTEPVRVGVAGMGVRGLWIGQMVRDNVHSALVAVADTNPRMLQIARALFPEVELYDSNVKMLQEAPLDAIVVGTSDRFHAQNGLEALRGGKHVLIEKPLAQSFDDLEKLARLRRETGLTVGTFLELRHSLLWKRVKEIVQSGEIGAVLSAYLCEHVGRDKAQFFSRDKTRSRQNVVSLVLQKGVHGLDLLNWMVDSSPIRVNATGARRFFGGDQSAEKRCRDCEQRRMCEHAHNYKLWMDPPGIEFQHDEDRCVWSEAADVEDISLVNIEYASGVVASYHEVHFAPYYGLHMTLFGSKAQLDVEANHDTGLIYVEVTRRYGNRDQRRERPITNAGDHAGGDPLLLNDFVLACLEGYEPLCDLRAGYESAAIGVGTRQSIDSGNSVAIKPFETLG